MTSIPCTSSETVRLQEEYAYNGFCGPIKVFPKDTEEEETVRKITQGYYNYAQIVSNKYSISPPSGDWRFRVHLLQSWALKVATAPALVSTVKAVLRSNDIVIWSTDLNIKCPSTHKYYSWHQDSTYTGLEPADACVTAWYAITDSNSLNGCLRMIKGTHKLGQLKHAQGLDQENNVLALGQYVADNTIVLSRESQQVNMELKAGEASLHHFFAVHNSGINKCTSDRVGLAIRYLDASKVQPRIGTREFVTHVSGVLPSNSRFDLEEIVTTSELESFDEDISEEGLRVWKTSMQNEKNNYFQHSILCDFK